MLFRLLIILLLGSTGALHAQSAPDTLKRAELVTPDSIRASELGALVLDPHVTSFVMTWFDGGTLYTFKISGNTVFGEARTKIQTLPRNTNVLITEIVRKEDDGSITNPPPQLYIIQ